ncbi:MULTISPECIES: hypothetical protein [unclassified Burkholderia]|nr:MULTISPECIES: hypothetical protein [unclassified Burkholderia]
MMTVASSEQLLCVLRLNRCGTVAALARPDPLEPAAASGRTPCC